MKYMLLLPALVAFALFTAWPMAEVTRLSLSQTNFIRSEYVGLRNFSQTLSQPDFQRSVANSALYAVLMIVIVVGGALAIGLIAMGLPKAWQDATRFVVYIPMLSAGIIVAQVWRWIFHADGPINWLLSISGCRRLRGFPDGTQQSRRLLLS